MPSSFPSETPSYFADAEASRKNADFVIFGVPYEKTVTFRKGTDKGPLSIRKASWNFESFNIRTGIDLQNQRIHDYGDLACTDQMKPDKVNDMVKTFTSQLVQENRIPIVIGGEHSISAGIIHGFSKDIGILMFDAHADYRDSFESNRYNHACTTRRIADYIGNENILICGLRSAGKKEYRQLKQNKIKYVDAFEIYHNKMDQYTDEIASFFHHKKIYVSIDIDVFDPAFAPGTGAPEPFGLHPFDVLEGIDCIAEKIVGFDVMEVNPLYDHGQTAVLAAKVIRYTIEQIISCRKK